MDKFIFLTILMYTLQMYNLIPMNILISAQSDYLVPC